MTKQRRAVFGSLLWLGGVCLVALTGCASESEVRVFLQDFAREALAAFLL